MVAGSVAPQIGWLYPVALIGLIAGVWWRGRAPRTDPVRAGFLMWAVWLAVYAAAFSTGRVAHTFYVIAVAPAIAALAGGGLVVLWRAYRRGGWQRWLLPVAVAATVAWGFYLSRQFPTFLPWMPPLLLALGALSVAVLVTVQLARRGNRGLRTLTARMALAGLATAVVAVLLAPTAWAVSTVDSRYGGSGVGPAAGPMTRFGPGGGMPPAVRWRFGERRTYDGQDRPGQDGRQLPDGIQVPAAAKPAAVDCLQAGSATAHRSAPRLSGSSRGCGLTSRAARTHSPCRVRTKPASTFSPEPAFSRWGASPAWCRSRQPAS
jgi:hypothetical protein